MKTMVLLLWNDPKAARKFIVALVGALLIAVNLGLFPAALGGWMPVLIAFTTSLGVYRAVNEKAGDE